MSSIPVDVTIVEVGPRDGLQNEQSIVPAIVKVELINLLSQAGLPVIEIGSFVSPNKVPTMADTLTVAQTIQRQPNTCYAALVPNQQGYNEAVAGNVDMICLFTAASETFCQKNINCSIAGSIERFRGVIAHAQQDQRQIRAYISCCLGCPYEGDVPITKVVQLAKELYVLGCTEISLGDTIGIGTPKKAQQLLKAVSEEVPIQHVAVHFHDTYGQALANIYACLDVGIRIIDSAIAGLGGCPYAPGASGNVATEDVIYLLNGLNLTTNIDLDKLLIANQYICQQLPCTNHSKVAQARTIV